MKKFCSKCGNQLDLGKRSCTVCQSFNPYFISGFTSKEPAVKTEVIQDIAVSNDQTRENEFLRTEQLERERVELSLKNELLRVKEENELYKKETLDLVKEVQKELHDIDKENKLLKEKVESLKSSRPVEQKENTAPSVQKEEVKSTSKGMMAMAAIVLLIITTAVSYFFFSKGATKTEADTVNTTQSASTPSITIATNAKKTTAPDVDSTPAHKLLALATTPAPKPVTPALSPAPVPAAVKPNSTLFSLTTSRAINDLVGKKLSGCDITIKSSSEIEHLDNLVLVDKLSASYLKYKCTVKIKQGNDAYTASPYIYYSAEGTFIKVDGTNCE